MTFTGIDLELQFCPECYQMTNHHNGVCLKCENEEAKLSDADLTLNSEYNNLQFLKCWLRVQRKTLFDNPYSIGRPTDTWLNHEIDKSDKRQHEIKKLLAKD